VDGARVHRWLSDFNYRRADCNCDRRYTMSSFSSIARVVGEHTDDVNRGVAEVVGKAIGIKPAILSAFGNTLVTELVRQKIIILRREDGV